MVIVSMAVLVVLAMADRPSAADALTLSPGEARLLKLPRTPTTVFAADSGIAALKVPGAQRVLVRGKAIGDTTFFALDSDGRTILRRKLVVRRDLTAVRRAVAQAAAPYEVEIRALKNAVVLEGQVDSPDRADQVIQAAKSVLGEDVSVQNHLKIQTPAQINLRVRVAEMTRDVRQLLGVNWEAIANDGELFLGLARGRDFIDDTGTTLLRGGSGEGESTGSFAVGVRDGNDSVNALVDALANEELATVVAEPNLTAMSGETASFFAGGEFAVPEPDDDGIAIEFKEFGVRLEFTPTIRSRNRINLKISTEVSERSDAAGTQVAGVQVPGTQTTSASTRIEIGSGQSFAIAGLVKRDTSERVDKLPGLGDIPVLGGLFTSTAFEAREREIVVTVAPYVVQPTAPENLALPTDGYMPGDQARRMLEQKVGRERPARGTGAPATAEAPELHGRAGFAY